MNKKKKDKLDFAIVLVLLTLLRYKIKNILIINYEWCSLIN